MKDTIKFLNISNHVLTDEQVSDLNRNFPLEVEIVELPTELKKNWSSLNPVNYKAVCDNIIDFMKENNINHAHLAGFMPAVMSLYIDYRYLTEYNAHFYYSFSERVSEEKEVNGEIIKTSVFKHRGWYEY